MRTVCPKCGEANQVAGLFEKLDSVHLETKQEVYCGFCGSRFVPPGPAEAKSAVRIAGGSLAMYQESVPKHGKTPAR